MNKTEAPAVRLLKLKRVAEQLDISVRTVEHLIAAGKLATTRIGAAKNSPRLVRSDELARFIDSLDTVRHPSVREIRSVAEGRNTP